MFERQFSNEAGRSHLVKNTSIPEEKEERNHEQKGRSITTDIEIKEGKRTEFLRVFDMVKTVGGRILALYPSHKAKEVP